MGLTGCLSILLPLARSQALSVHPGITEAPWLRTGEPA